MATAMELTSEQLKRYKLGAQRRAARFRLTPVEEARREALLQRAREAAALLKTQFGARRVMLFGSLVHRAWFTPDSDVDLAVQGLAGDYWQAWRSVEDIFKSQAVDLIELESASESLRRVIQEEGMEL